MCRVFAVMPLLHTPERGHEYFYTVKSHIYCRETYSGFTQSLHRVCMLARGFSLIMVAFRVTLTRDFVAFVK